MKKEKLSHLATLACLAFSAGSLLADIAPPLPKGQHNVINTIQIVNLADYPDVIIVYQDEGTTHPSSANELGGLPYRSDFVSKSSAEVTLNYVIPKASFDAAKAKAPTQTPSSDPWQNAYNDSKIVLEIPLKLQTFKPVAIPKGKHIAPDGEPTEVAKEFTIAGYSEGKLVIYKSKETRKYADGTVDVQTWTQPSNLTVTHSP